MVVSEIQTRIRKNISGAKLICSLAVIFTNEDCKFQGRGFFEQQINFSLSFDFETILKMEKYMLKALCLHFERDYATTG